MSTTPTVNVDHDCGMDDEGLAPGWYAAVDGLALAGPAPTKASALAALCGHLEDEGHGETTPPTVWRVTKRARKANR